MTERDDQKPIDDVIASFAWGQSFAKSLIGGLAVWKLLHKMTNTEPSEWFHGLSVAYEQVRDFVLIPFQWMQLELTASERDSLVVGLVLLGGFIRAVTQMRFMLRKVLLYALTVLLGMAFLFGSTYFISVAPPTWDAHAATRIAMVVFGVTLVVLAVLQPLAHMFAPLGRLLMLRRDPDLSENRFHQFDLESRFHHVVLMNVVFTLACGTIFLLLNWATS